MADNDKPVAKRGRPSYASQVAELGIVLIGSKNASNSVMEGASDTSVSSSFPSTLSEALSPRYLFTSEVTHAHSVPTRILAQMRLAEYFMETEGDVRQTVEIAMDLGLQEITIDHADSKVVEEFQALFAALDMDAIVHDIWYCLDTYGQAYPAEVWEGATPLNISVFDPKLIVVDRQASFAVPQFRLAYNGRTIGEEIRRGSVPNEIGSLFVDVKEGEAGSSLGFKDGVIFQIRNKTPQFKPYCTSPLTPIFRDLSTRQVLEEMIRGTIEGVKNQLWVFKVADPLPGEIKRLQDVLSGNAGERTGYLVWNARLSVEQHTPKAIDALLANESWMRLTKAIMRGRGISMKVVSGEVDGVARGGDIDVQIFLQRLHFQQSRIVGYLQSFANRYAKANSVKRPPKITLAQNDLEVESLIKNRVLPLWRAGLTSPQSALADAGKDYETELRQKQESESYRYYFVPLPTFSQTTVHPDTPEKTALFDPNDGRATEANPVGKTQPMQGTVVVLGEVDEYRTRIAVAHGVMKSTFNADRVGSVKRFVEELRAANGQYMPQAYTEGYRAAGGRNAPDPSRVAAVVGWNNGYVDGYEQDLMGEDIDENRLNAWQGRSHLYAIEGRKMAYAYGVFQAKREQGYTGWRRVIAGEACEKCKRDGAMVHPIEEEFYEIHPNGACGHESISFYRGNTSGLPLILPHRLELPQNPAGGLMVPNVTSLTEEGPFGL